MLKVLPLPEGGSALSYWLILSQLSAKALFAAASPVVCPIAASAVRSALLATTPRRPPRRDCGISPQTVRL